MALSEDVVMFQLDRTTIRFDRPIFIGLLNSQAFQTSYGGLLVQQTKTRCPRCRFSLHRRRFDHIPNFGSRTVVPVKDVLDTPCYPKEHILYNGTIRMALGTFED